MSERYIKVTCRLLRKNVRSFIVENGSGEEVVVGRSCVHGVDEKELSDTEEGEEVTFRVMDWLAEKHDL